MPNPPSAHRSTASASSSGEILSLCCARAPDTRAPCSGTDRGWAKAGPANKTAGEPGAGEPAKENQPGELANEILLWRTRRGWIHQALVRRFTSSPVRQLYSLR